MWLLLPACLKNRKESVRQGPRLISSGSGNQTRKMYICQKLKDFIKLIAQALRSRDAKRKRYCCVLIVNQPALLIALADYAISDKLAVRGGIGGTLCTESVQNDRNTKMLFFVWKLATMTGGWVRAWFHSSEQEIRPQMEVILTVKLGN